MIVTFARAASHLSRAGSLRSGEGGRESEREREREKRETKVGTERREAKVERVRKQRRRNEDKACSALSLSVSFFFFPRRHRLKKVCCKSNQYAAASEEEAHFGGLPQPSLRPLPPHGQIRRQGLRAAASARGLQGSRHRARPGAAQALCDAVGGRIFLPGLSVRFWSGAGRPLFSQSLPAQGRDYRLFSQGESWESGRDVARTAWKGGSSQFADLALASIAASFLFLPQSLTPPPPLQKNLFRPSSATDQQTNQPYKNQPTNRTASPRSSSATSSAARASSPSSGAAAPGWRFWALAL